MGFITLGQIAYGMKTTLTTLFSLLVLVLHLTLNAQQIQRCVTTNLEFERFAKDPDYANQVNAIRAQIETFVQNQPNQRFTGDVYHIPVVVHVIYNTPEQNISDEQIALQIASLNADYRRLNEDASNTRQEFMPVAADVGIEFHLAQWDPEGNQTSGITRTETTQGSFWLSMTDMKSSQTGGSDAWDVNHYLNIWVCNMSIPFLNVPFILGFATPPDGAPNWPVGSAAEEPEQDGVVIHYEVFGPIQNPDATLDPVSLGRTATHEIGHYLGLRHIWGDGDCSADDGIQDTPIASAAQQQTCDLSSNTCDEGSGDLPDMIENYMDYSDEHCMNMFTQQQVMAMRYVVENFRQNLLLSASNFDSKMNLQVYPNPASDFIMISYESPIEYELSVSLRDITGRIYFQTTMSKMLQLPVFQLTDGLYFIDIHSKDEHIVHKFIKHQ